jgi:hypothetical protein
VWGRGHRRFAQAQQLGVEFDLALEEEMWIRDHVEFLLERNQLH